MVAQGHLGYGCAVQKLRSVGCAFLISMGLVACEARETSAPPGPVAAEVVSGAPATLAPSASALAPVLSASAASAVAPAEIASAEAPAPAASVAVPTPPPASKASASLPKSEAGILKKGQADGVLKKGAAPLVVLIGAGDAPREKLAYTFVVGEKRPLDVGLDVKMTVHDASGKELPTAVPRMTMRLDIATLSMKESDANVEALLGDVKVGGGAGSIADARIASALAPQLDSIRGLRMTYRVTSRGLVRDLVVSPPPGMPAAAQQALSSMSQSFESMTTPFPQEAVGKGARWHVTNRVESGGADILQRVTYTLDSRAGDEVHVSLLVEQAVADEVVKAPGLPASVVARIKKFRSSGSGNLVTRLSSPAAETGELSLSSSMTVAVAGGGAVAVTGGAQESAIDSLMKVTYTRPTP